MGTGLQNMALAVEENNLICCFSDGDGLFLCLNVTGNDAERKELLWILFKNSL